jgi:hypothetical protein
MLNRSKLATAVVLAVSMAWVALPADANAQPRYRGAAAFGYQNGVQYWRVRAPRACTYVGSYIGGPKGFLACR